MPPIEVPSFTITALSGPPTVLRFVGRALPFRPFKLTGTQRVVTDWLPGSPEATQTVLGPAEEPTTISGKWSDKYLQTFVGTSRGAIVGGVDISGGKDPPATLNGEPVESVRALAKAIDTLRRQGQRVEVQWDQQTRRGVVSRFDQQWLTVHDLEWSLDFDWDSQADGEGTPLFSLDTSPGDAAAALVTAQDKLVDGAVPAFPTEGTFLSELQDGIAALEYSVNQATGALSGLAQRASGPADTARRLLSVFTGVVVQAQAVMDRATAAPPAVFAYRPPTQAALSFGRQLAAGVYLTRLRGRARGLQREAVIRRQVMAAQLQDQLLGVYSARGGEDLRDVSRRYYGTSAHWRDLLLFNHLRSSELVPGQTVQVPTLQTGDV